ncbi:MAG: hypothetical protein NXI32_02230 [bacterium]|nr:hypothetical protein [bacterium]
MQSSQFLTEKDPPLPADRHRKLQRFQPPEDGKYALGKPAAMGRMDRDAS